MAAYELPDLPYDYGALAPHISGEIMELHHSKHHAAYVKGVNTALEQLAEARDGDSFGNINKLEKDLAFHLGGHINHSVFWPNMSPEGGDRPDGALGNAIDEYFGGFDKFKEELKKAGVGRFGSGWVWLVNEGGKLAITSTPNQDNPLMEGKKAIFGIDVWEHAYYLNYQNRRPDFVGAFQRGDDAGKIIGLDPHVAVGKNDNLVSDARRHVDEVGDLAIDPMCAGVDHEIDITTRLQLAQTLDDRDCTVVGILHSEDDLNIAAIILGAEGAQIIEQARFVAMQWLENSDCRRANRNW